MLPAQQRSGFDSRGESEVQLILYNTRNFGPLQYQKYWNNFMKRYKLVALVLPWVFIKEEMYFAAFLARISFPTSLWGSRREFGETLRNRKSISNEGSLTNNFRNCKASKRQQSHVFMYIHVHSILILCGTSESRIRCVIETWQGSALCNRLPTLHAQYISS